MKISRRLMLRLSGLGATTMALMGCAGQGEGFLAWLEGLFPSASVPGTPAQPERRRRRPGAALRCPLQRRPADR